MPDAMAGGDGETLSNTSVHPDKESSTVRGASLKAEEVTIGYHPDGFRIDKTAGPMNRYTRWFVQPDGQWAQPRAVCFHSLPEEGWVRCEGFDWSESESS